MYLLDRFLLIIHGSFHPITENRDWTLLYFVLNILHTLQSIALLGIKTSSYELQPIQTMVDYAFYLTTFNDQEFLLFIILLFIINIIIVSTSISLLFYNIQTLTFILQLIIVIYCKVLLIPNLYTSIYFYLNGQICDLTISCQSKVPFIIMCIINVVISQGINGFYIYFGRSDRIIDENILLEYNHNLFLECLKKALLNILVILFSMNSNIVDLQIISVFMYWSVVYILNISCIKFQSRLESTLVIIAIVITISLRFNYAMYEFATVGLFILAIHISVQQWLINIQITNKNQVTINRIQLIEYADIHQQKQYYSIVRSIMYKNHSCIKCKHGERISLCLMKQLILKNSNQQISIFYCYQIEQQHKFKCLIYLINLAKNSGKYYRLASKYLILKLLHELKIQQQSHLRLENRSYQDIQISLDLQTYCKSYNIASIIFPELKKTLQSICHFWRVMIQGQKDMRKYIQIIEVVSLQMITLRNLIESEFDIELLKQKFCNYQDILSLRILQIYYSAIYISQFKAQQLDQNIEDILKQDRFKQEAHINNLQLQNNQVLILTTSLIFNRGLILNHNAKKISSFMNLPEELFLQYKNINQFMPYFISSVHNFILDQYVTKGTSILMFEPRFVYLQLPSGFIELNHLQLSNLLDKSDDIQISAILSKVIKNNKILLFGVDGRILGIDEESFRMLKQNNNEQITKPILISDFIAQGLIQYYIPDIEKHIRHLQKSIKNQQCYCLNGFKSVWQFPTNNQELLSSTGYTLSQFEPHNGKTLYSAGTLKTFKNMIIQETDEKKSTLYYDRHEYSDYVNEGTLIDDNLILMLHEDFIKSVQINELTSITNGQTSIEYNLEYKQYRTANLIVGFFQITFIDISAIKQLKYTDQYTSTQVLQTLTKMNDSQEQLELQIEDLDKVSDPGIQLTTTNQQYQFIHQLTQKTTFPSQTQINQGEQYQLFTNRQSIVQITENFINKNTINEQQYQVSIDPGKSNNNQKKKKKLDIQIDQSVHQSTQWMNNTKESNIIINQLNQRGLIFQLKMGLIMFALIALIMVISIIVNVVTINNNLNIQLDDAYKITCPKELLFIYTTYYFLNLQQYLIQQKTFNYSQGINDRITYFWGFTKSYAESVLPQYFDCVFTSADSYQKLSYSANYIVNDKLLKVEMNLDDFFYNMYTQLIVSYQQKEYFKIVDQKGFAHQNIVQIIQINDQLFDLIKVDSINRSTDILNEFVYYLIFELLIIFGLMVLKYALYRQIDSIKKSVVFLVARISENEAKQQIKNLESIISIIEDESAIVWKKYDFSVDIFEPFIKNTDTNIRSTTKISGGKVIKKSGNQSIYSKITKDSYYDLGNITMLLLITGFWIIYLVTGYLVYDARLQEIQPSMNLTYSFTDLKKNLNNVGLLATIIKTDILIQNPISSHIDQSAIILELQQQLSTLSTLMTQILDLILSMKSGYFTQFTNILNSNLCTYYSGFLSMCNVTDNGKILSRRLLHKSSRQWNYRFCEWISNLFRSVVHL